MKFRHAVQIALALRECIGNVNSIVFCLVFRILRRNPETDVVIVSKLDGRRKCPVVRMQGAYIIDIRLAKQQSNTGMRRKLAGI